MSSLVSSVGDNNFWSDGPLIIMLISDTTFIACHAIVADLFLLFIRILDAFLLLAPSLN
jgi:hypothetical protein